MPQYDTKIQMNALEAVLHRIKWGNSKKLLLVKSRNENQFYLARNIVIYTIVDYDFRNINPRVYWVQFLGVKSSTKTNENRILKYHLINNELYGNSIEFIMKHYYIILTGFKLIQIIPWLRFVLGCSNGKIVREINRHYDLYLIHVVKPMVCQMKGIHCNWWNLKCGPKNIQPFKWNIILEKSIYSIFNNFCEKKNHVRNENIINISFFKNVFTLTCYSFPC